VAAKPVALAVLASGGLLFLLDLRARRIRVDEVAGAVVLAKLAAVALMALKPPLAQALFWGLVVASSLSSHAPKDVRHWPRRNGRRG
jgi:hypothetical protein